MTNAWERLGAFLRGVAAASVLLNRAGERGSFIEAICLTSNIIDAQLRIGIILQHQIETNSRDIPVEYLFQEEQGRKFSERDIFKIAKSKKVINDDLYQNLSDIYDERNRVIHRYIITDITTHQVLDVGIRYENILREINNRIVEIEKEQIRLGVGITVIGPIFEGPEAKEWLTDMADEKHASFIISNAIKQKR